MEIRIRGKQFSITREDVMGATQSERPHAGDARHRYFVKLRRQEYPIKQVVRLVTGLPLAGFTAQDAHRILSRLGFDISERSAEEPLRTEIPAHANGDLTSPAAGPTNDGNEDHGEVLRLLVVFETDEDGWEVASCPSLPGCHSQGRTREEALANIREAIRGYLASMREHGAPLPSPSEFQVLEVPA